jgi:hypothetical protein
LKPGADAGVAHRIPPSHFIRSCFVGFGFVTALIGGALAQEAKVRSVEKLEMAAHVDSNSPAFWRENRLHWYGSTGRVMLNQAPELDGPWQTREVIFHGGYPAPHWVESIWADDDGKLWCWYHCEPIGLIEDSTLTAPKIGAGVSTDGGATFEDFGIVMESGDPMDPGAKNGYFASGHGDFSVILNEERTYFYFFFGNYGGAPESQGVGIARMKFHDRLAPTAKVWKYYDGEWLQTGIGGRVTPIFPVKRAWQLKDPDAFWGPSVHWNTFLKCYVMLLNRAKGEPGWSQEGVYISFCSDLHKPETWTEPKRILDQTQFANWHFFYPQVMGLEAGGTDTRAGRIARLYVSGISKWEIEFAPTPPPPEKAPEPEPEPNPEPEPPPSG